LSLSRSALFVSLEGIEGAGKSSVLPALADAVLAAGLEVELTREPGGGPLGEALRQIFLNPSLCLDASEELLLLYAGRRDHLHRRILPALAAGKVVLCDRFEDSSYAYQGGGRQEALARIRQLSQWAGIDREPDLTFWLDLPPEQAVERIRARQPDRLEREDLDFFRRAREVFAARAKGAPHRIVRIDASLPLATVQETAVGILCERLSIS